MSTFKKLTAAFLALAMFCAVTTDLATAVTAERYNSLYDSSLFDAAIPESPYRELVSRIDSTNANNSIIASSDKKARSELLIGNRIRISNLKQLLAIGSGFSVTDADLNEGAFSSGEQVYYDDGTPARYTDSADYYIANDIALNGAAIMLPEDLSGSIIGAPKAGKLTAYTSSGGMIAAAQEDSSSVSGESFNRYEVEHLGVISMLADLAGAEERGASGVRELKAYKSASKFVGMADAVLKDNPIGIVPMPAEKKDPCEDEPIEITVQKVWNDDNDARHHRPESLRVVIETVEYGASVPDRAVIAGWVPASLRGSIVDTRSIVLTAADADPLSDTWRRVVDDLEYGFCQNGKYYVYYVHESTPEYYNSAYTVDHASGTVKLTNTYWRLPDTGAWGETMYLLTGTALLITSAALAIYIQIKNRKRRHYGTK
ncbi:MAG: Cna B-type domain-containing protein [Clostridia bacterium]|nr:Cna B-type domain-containing protein [Clostridia bacterium]